MTVPRYPRQPKTFTMIEVAVALSISVLVGGVVFSFWQFGIRHTTGGTDLLFLHSKVRSAMTQMIRELRAARFINSVKKNRIAFTRFYDKKTEPEVTTSGDPDFRRIEYFVQKKNKRTYFIRKVNDQAKPLFSCEAISDNLFIPYFEDPKKKTFHPFDMKENDSGKRRNITYIRLRFSVKNRKSLLHFFSGVGLRVPHRLMKQPHWNMKH